MYIYSGNGDFGFLNRTGSGLKRCLLTVGSLWRMVKSGDHIWGTGQAYSGIIEKRCNKTMPGIEMVKNITVYSSRGPLSAKSIKSNCQLSHKSEPSSIEGAGDAGFLVPFLFPEMKMTGYRANNSLCLIPHKKDIQKAQTY